MAKFVVFIYFYYFSLNLSWLYYIVIQGVSLHTSYMYIELKIFKKALRKPGLSLMLFMNM